MLDDHAMFPSALPARRETSYNAWVTIQIGCDNSCAFCIVPAVRGDEISRPFADVVDEVAALAAQGVTEVTLLGQNVNSYGRDLQLAARQRRRQRRRALRPLFADLLERRRRRRRHPPGALHVARTPRTCGRRRSRRWPTRRPCASTCTTRCSPARDRVLAAMHRGYTAERYLAAARRRPARRRPTSPCRPTSSSASRARPTTTSQRTLEVAAAARFDYAYTFIFSPRPGTEAADDAPIASSTRPSPASASTACASSSSAARSHANEARVGRVEEVLVEGPSKKRPGRARRAHPPAPARALRAAAAVARRRLRDGRDHPRRAAPSRRSSSSSCSPSPPPHAHPRRRVVTRRAAGRRCSARPRRASRTWRWLPPEQSPAPRSSPSTRCRCTAAWTSAPPSRRRAERAAVPHHCLDLVDPSRDFTVTEFRARVRRGDRRHRRARRAGARSSPAPGSTYRRSIDDLDLPGRVARRPRRPATPRPTLPAAATRRLGELDPPPRRRSSPANRRRIVRALEVTIGSGRPFSSFGPGRRRLSRRSPSCRSACGGRATCSPSRIEQRVHGDDRRRPARRGRAALRAGRAVARPPRQALGYKELLAHLDGVHVARRRASPQIVLRTRQFAVRQERWFRRDPRVRWIDVDPRDDPVAEPRRRSWRRHSTMSTLTLTKHHGLGNDFLVVVPSAGARATCRPSPQAAVRPPPRDRRRRPAGRRVRRRATRPAWCCSTPTAAGPR